MLTYLYLLGENYLTFKSVLDGFNTRTLIKTLVFLDLLNYTKLLELYIACRCAQTGNYLMRKLGLENSSSHEWAICDKSLLI